MFLNSKKSLLKITFLFVFFVIFLMTMSNAYTELRDYEININVLNDGSMHVEEIWKVEAEDITTLFKTFKSGDGYSSIENVSVKETTGSKNDTFTQTSEYKYKQDPGMYHALVNPDGEFEIAWGAPMDGETRTFVVEYDVYDVVTRYNDCEDFYWKIVGETFDPTIDHLHGTVTIPSGISDLDDFRIWAHGTLNGSLEKTSTREFTYRVDNNASRSFVELRVTTPTGIFMEGVKHVNVNKLDDILSEEQRNADDANRQREHLAKVQKMQMMAGNIGGAIVGFLCLLSFSKRRAFLETHPKLVPEVEYDYFRDIPDKALSGFDACAIGEINAEVSQKISSLLMSLALKNYLSFDIQSKNKKDMYIILAQKSMDERLNEHERNLFDYLRGINETGRFSLKDFEKYGTSHVSKVDRLLDRFDELTKEHLKEYGIIDEERKSKSEGARAVLVLIITLAMFALPMLLTIGSYIGAGILGVLALVTVIDLGRFSSKVGKFTQKGVDEKVKWAGLKKFMKEFSMLDQREIPELALWEEYLVYATAFGVADEVIKQLKVVYPELNDAEYLANNYTVLNMAGNDSFGKSFSNSLASSIGSVTNMSSGSGGGGGFSSGGGGGGGRRWRRRSLKNGMIYIK